MQNVFIWTAAAVACSDLILNGVLERHPDLRVGCFETSGIWVPMHLMLLDGGFDVTRRLNGRSHVRLPDRPSDYFRRQVRVAAFAYERPARLAARSAPLYFAATDCPHSVGTADLASSYASADPAVLEPEHAEPLFTANAAFLLGR